MEAQLDALTLKHINGRFFEGRFFRCLDNGAGALSSSRLACFVSSFKLAPGEGSVPPLMPGVGFPAEESEEEGSTFWPLARKSA